MYRTRPVGAGHREVKPLDDWWMTQTLHRFPDENPFDYKRQLADLQYISRSTAAMTGLAENYVGLPMDLTFWPQRVSSAE